MARRRTWDSEAYTPYYEDDDPSLYRPSIRRRLLVTGIVLVPIVAAALLVYSFIRVYIVPPKVAVAPTSIAMREPNMVVPMTTGPRDDAASRVQDLQSAPRQANAPALAAAPPVSEQRAETPSQTGSLLPWPGSPAPVTAAAPPVADISTGSIATAAAVPLPRRRPHPTAAAEVTRTLPRLGVPTDNAPAPAPTPTPPDALSSTSYGTPN